MLHMPLLLVLLLASWFRATYSHSSSARPLKKIAHPSTLALEILPRASQLSLSTSPFSKRLPANPNILRYDDSFRLTICAFDEIFYLHLRPNNDLIHPAARVQYYSIKPNGESYVTHSEPLLRESVRAYWGEVIASYHSSTRMREDAAGAVPASHPSVLGWARLMVHQQGDAEKGAAPEFEGAFSVNGVVHHIMTKDNYLRTKNRFDPDISQRLDDSDASLIIWRDSDVMTAEEEHWMKGRASLAEFPNEAPQTCGHDRLGYNTDPTLNPILRKAASISRFSNPLVIFYNGTKDRRDDVGAGQGGMNTNFINNIGSSAGCPNTQKVVYMGVAADCAYTTNYGSQDNATRQILTDWNSSSSLYKTTFNISLGIVELQVQAPTCPSTPDPARPWNVACSGAQLDSRLSLFSQWRGNKGPDGSGLWHLMSGCPTGSEVGIAWLATLCQQDASGSAPSVVSGTAVSTAGRTEWQVVAHEIGHNFGAIHDCASGCTTSNSCCPLSASTCDANAQFIMSPVAQTGETVFSPCSLGNICSLMTGVAGSKTNTTCLVDPDPNRQTISLQMCGNGIVETGEDCDPGKGVNSTCCDSTTCKFKNNAVCDPQSSPCCTTQCSFAPVTQVCRPSRDSKCDTAEMCTGNSSSCPADVTAPNGQVCGSSNLKCASGQCTSVALQCQTIGASMGLKDACPNHGDTSCRVSCQDPTQHNQCISLSSMLIDGSPCGYGGACYLGKCQSSGFLDTAKAWYTQNLQISIPVTVVVGIVALLVLWAIVRAIIRCSRRRKRFVPSTIPVPGSIPRSQHESVGGHGGYPSGIPPRALSFPQANPMYNRAPAEYVKANDGGPGGWVDDSLYNGSRR